MRNLMLAVFATTTLVAGLTPARALAADRYLIQSTHKPEDCLTVLDDVAAQDKKLLTKLDWGCMAGDHTAYIIVEATSEDDARSKLPEKMRANAKVQKLNHFTVAEIRSFHQK
jgi:hypothetical protein